MSRWPLPVRLRVSPRPSLTVCPEQLPACRHCYPTNQRNRPEERYQEGYNPGCNVQARCNPIQWLPSTIPPCVFVKWLAHQRRRNGTTISSSVASNNVVGTSGVTKTIRAAHVASAWRALVPGRHNGRRCCVASVAQRHRTNVATSTTVIQPSTNKFKPSTIQRGAGNRGRGGLPGHAHGSAPPVWSLPARHEQPRREGAMEGKAGAVPGPVKRQWSVACTRHVQTCPNAPPAAGKVQTSPQSRHNVAGAGGASSFFTTVGRRCVAVAAAGGSGMGVAPLR